MRKFYLVFVALTLFTLSKIYAQVSVTATAGLPGPTVYTNLTNAFASINAGIHQGDIVISISANTTEGNTPAILNSPTAAPASYTTVTIQPTANVTVSSVDASPALIKLNGTDNVTINGSVGGNQLTFSNTNASNNAAVIWVASASAADRAANNIIRDCIISGVNTGTTSTTTYAGIISSSGTTLTSNADGANSDNTYDNNTIRSCYIGIALLGVAGNESGNVISGNTIGSAVAANKIDYRGVYVSNQTAVSINNNTVFGVSGNNSGNANPTAGITVGGSISGGNIYNNRISDVKNTNTVLWTALGINLQSTGTCSPALNIYNNFVWDVAGIGDAGFPTDNGHGIGVRTGGGYNIYNNSVNLATNQTNAAVSAAIFVFAATSGSLDIRNNIFANQQGTGTRYAIYSQAANTAYTNINYNDYYSTGVLGFLSAQRNSLAAWQSATGQDVNSVNVNPTFVSNVDLHLAPSSPLNATGTAIGIVTTDIDGQARPGTPDIGADEFTPPACSSSSGGTATASTSTICSSGSVTLSATGYSFGTGISYQWESATAIGGPYGPLAGLTSPLSAVAPVINVTTYYRLAVTCGTTGYSNIVTVTVNNPTATPTGATRCGYGTVNLTSTGTGTGLNWYTAAVGGTPAGSGGTFTTPAIGATTTYYVSANTSTTSSVGPALASGVCGTIATSTLTDWPLRFNTTGAVVLVSAQVLPVAAGTFVVGLRNSLSTVNIDTRSFTFTAGQVGVVQTIALNFIINTPGSYQITNIQGGIARFSPFGCSYPYVSAGGNFSIVGSATFSTSTTSTSQYNSFFNLQVQDICEGTRVPVTATITAPPVFSTLSAAPATICGGSNVNLTVASANAGYTYQWEPGSLAGPAQTVTPAATGYYVVTATDASGGANNGCVRKDSVLVTVNPTPTDMTINPAAVSVCSNTIVKLDAIGGSVNNFVKHTENFNSGLGTWTVGGTGPGIAAWAAQTSPYTYNHFGGFGNTTFSSNDNSGFVMANSDVTGSGTSTTTYLISPVLDMRGFTSATLSFWHHLDRFSSTEINRVEYSTDGGGTWNTLQNYTSDQGGPTSFTNANLTIPPAALVQLFRIRFNYTADFDWFWAIDNITLSGTYTPATWLPVTELFTDAACTLPYVAGTKLATVWARPTVTRTYTATSDAGAGCTKTASSTLTVAAVAVAVSITSSDANNIICAGENVTYTATPSNGGTNPNYTWRVNGVIQLTGPFQNVFSTSTLANGDVVSVTLASNLACATNNPATTTLPAVTVEPVPTVNITSSLASVCVGGPATTLTANTTGVITGYQWYLGVTPIGGATASTYVTDVPGSYSVVVNNSAPCTATGNYTLNATTTYTITATAAPNGTISPSGAVSVSCGANQTFTITPNLTYQILTIVVDGTPLGGGPWATAQTYTFNNVNINHTITATFGNVGCGNDAWANAGPDASLCTGSLFALPVNPVASVGGNAAVTNALSSWSTLGTGTFSSTVFNTAGATYNPSAADISAGFVKLVLTTNDPPGAACTVGTDTMTITFIAAPSVSTSGIFGFCPAASTTITATSSIISPYTLSYQWYNGAVPIGGATLPTRSFNVAGNYSVVVTGAPGGCTATSAFTIIAAANPTASIAGTNTICEGASSDLTAIAAAGSGVITSYQWNNSGGPIGGATANLYTLPEITETYTVTVNNSYGCTVTSAPGHVVTLNNGPLSGFYTIGLGPQSCTNFVSFDSAVSALNRRGISANVTMQAPSGYTETVPVGGLRLGSATLNASVGANRIRFQNDGAGVNPVLNAYAGGTATPGSAVPDGIWSISGTDNLTIDGIDLRDNNAANPATMEFGYGLFKANFVNTAVADGCQNDSIINCRITLNRINNANSTAPMVEGSVGIIIINSTRTAATTILTGATAIAITNGNGSNSNNKIYGNTIQNCNSGIVLNGFAATVGVGPAPAPATFLGDLNNDIGGTSAATGNSVLNYGGGGATNPAAGIRGNNQWGLNISYNTVNNNTGIGVNHATTLRGIYGQAGTSGNVTISNNNVTLTSGATTSLCTAIDNAIGTTVAGNTINITNNIITGGYPTSTTGAWDGISNTGAAATINITGNRIQNVTTSNTSTGAWRAITQAIASTSTVNILNNVITNNSTGSSGSFAPVNCATAATINVNDNSILNNSFLTSVSSNFIFVGGIGASVITVNNNTISDNLLNGGFGTATINGITTGTGYTSFTATGNRILNNGPTNVVNTSTITLVGINAAGTGAAITENIYSNIIDGLYIKGLGLPTALQNIIGIQTAAGTSATVTSRNIYSNYIANLFSTSGVSTLITGIRSSGAAASTTNIYKNLITRIYPGQSGVAGASGIAINANSGNTNIYNNMVNLDLTTAPLPAANGILTGADALRAINLTSTATINLYYNTIRLAGSGTGASFGTEGILRVGAGTFNLRNNIVHNLCTTGTANVGIKGAAGTVSSNYNDWVAPNQTLAQVITNTGAGQDANSISVVPVFVNVATSDLHMDVNLNPLINDAGTVLAAPYTTDMDDEVRSATAPDMGADEFAGVSQHYRSLITGNWNNAATWEVSDDLITWVPATNQPTAGSKTIEVRAAHTVTINTTATMDELTVNGVLELANSGKMQVANGTGSDVVVSGTGRLWVTNTTDNYNVAVTFAGAANLSVATGGRVTIGNGGAIGSDWNRYATDAPHLWANGSIFEWNNTGTFGTSSLTYFPNAAAGVTPIFRITLNGGTPGAAGTNHTIINGLFQVNNNVTWSGAANKTFRDGICGSAIMTYPAAVGTFNLGIVPPTGTASIILGGSNLRIVSDKQINIADNITVTVPIDSFVTVSSTNGSNISKGASSNFVVDGTADMTTVSISNGTGAVSINGTLRTAHTGGLESTGAGGTVSTAGSTTNVNHGSTIEYYATVNQAITGSGVLEPNGAGGDTYHHIKFSGSATKTPGNAVAVHDSVTITGTPVVDFMTNNLGSTVGEKFIMDGGRLRLGTTGTQPLMNGQYNLTGGVVEFGSNNVSSQNIRGTATNAYYNVEVTGNNVSQSSGNVNINAGGSFTIKTTGILNFTDAAITGPTGAQTFTMETGALFNVANVWGFNGPPEAVFPFRTPALHANFETITLNSNSTINYNRNAPLAVPHDQVVTNTVPYQNIIFSGLGIKSPSPGAILEVKGNITKAGTTASFGHNEGTVLLTGTALQTYIATATPIIEFNNLTSNNTVGLDVKSDMGINQKMLFGSAAIISLRDTSDVIIRSRADTTGWIAAIPVNVTINYQAHVDSGRFVVERYNYAAKKWRFYSIPTIQTQTVKAAWQEGATTSAQNPVPGYGTQIGSFYSNWAARNFDFNTPGGHDMKYWSEDASQQYIPLGRTDTIISTDRGYMKYVRGDRSVIGGAATASTLRTRGQIKRNAVSVPFTATAANQRFSAGNPYASAIDMRNITRTNASAMFYVWDPRLNNGVNGGVYGLGAFQLFTFDGTDYRVFPGTGSYGAANSVDNNIESGSAFFVQSNAAGAGSVAFNESSKTDGSREVFRGGAGTAERFMSILEAMTPTGEATMDGIMLDFAADNSNDINGEDGIKMANSGENISILKAGREMMFERHGTIVEEDTVFVKMTNMRQQAYRFKLLVENMAKPGLSAWLIDNYLNTYNPVDLAVGGYYNFEVNSSVGSSASNRFMIVFKQATVVPVKIVSIDAERNADETITVNWKVENETNIARYELERSENGRVFSTIVNNVAALHNNGGRAAYTRLDNQPLANDNFYRIKAVSINGRVDYSAIVKVSADKQPASITVNPNPVINRQMSVYFVKQAPGTYQLDFTAVNGQLISSSQVVVQGRNLVKQIYLKNDLAAGTYNLRITGPGNIIKVIPVFVE